MMGRVQSDRMLLWITEGPKPVIRERSSDYVMDSAINYLQYSTIERKYIALKLLADSGAYTAARKNMNLDPHRVLEIQQRLKPDICIPLDYPFMPWMTIKEIQERWRLTIENTRVWIETLNKKIEVMPIIHALGRRNLLETIKIISDIAGNSEYLAIGTIAFSIDSLKGYLGDRQLSVDFINALVEAMRVAKNDYGYKVHVAGFGSSPLTIHLAIYMGIDSTDSSGFRRRAAYGKILLPGRGERYVGKGDARFGVTRLTPQEMRLLERCDCPVCRRDPSLLWRDWRARAIHNEWILKRSWQEGVHMAQEDMEKYERFIDMMFENSSLRYIWKYVKIKRKYGGLRGLQ
ncbi:MAG: hypothetical protein LM590_06750 [Thermofilum sp.]|nr:hypothetical protein [Thermofilum sp.]